MQSLVSYQGSSHTNLRSGSAFISLGKIFDSKAKLKSLAFDAVCVYLNYTDYMFPKHTNIVACPSGHYCSFSTSNFSASSKKCSISTTKNVDGAIVY